MKARDVALGVAALGGAAAAAAYLMKQAQAAPPTGKFRLTIVAVADGQQVPVTVRVDGMELTTPGHVDLDPGTHTVSFPDGITDSAGVAYYYQSHEVV